VEIIAQWFDDLDDLFSAIALVAERLRNFGIASLILGISFLLQGAGVVLALRHPPIACAIATMLMVFLMYRSATAPRASVSRAA
jgi:hypothetical protein